MSWPTSDDAKLWCAVNGTVPPLQEQLVGECLDAAIDWLTKHATAERDEDPSPSVRQACQMLTARLFRRKQSPEGVAAFGDTGVRVYVVDADVRDLLSSEWAWGVA